MMLEFSSSVGAEAVTVFWLPLLAWTVAALPLWWLLSRSEGASPLTHYWGRVGLLFALPAGILGSALFSLLPASAVPVSAGPEPFTMNLSIAVISAAESTSRGQISWWAAAIGGATLIAAAFASRRLACIGIERYHLQRWKASLNLRPAGPAVRRAATTVARELGLKRRVDIRLTSAAVVPMTYGVLRPVIVLPQHLCRSEENLAIALAHELVHVRRHDYLVHSAMRFVAALFAIHPAVTRLSRSAERYREMSCDADVLSRFDVRPKTYATLLLNMTRVYDPHAPALSMAPRPSTLKQRIEAMTSKAFKQRSSTRLSLLAGSVLLSVSVLLIACSDLFVEKPSTSDTDAIATEVRAGLVQAKVDTDDRVLIDGVHVPLHELTETLLEQTINGQTYANVQIEGGATMAVVHEVMTSIREAGITHVRYSSHEDDSENKDAFLPLLREAE